MRIEPATPGDLADIRAAYEHGIRQAMPGITPQPRPTG